MGSSSDYVAVCWSIMETLWRKKVHQWPPHLSKATFSLMFFIQRYDRECQQTHLSFTPWGHTAQTQFISSKIFSAKVHLAKTITVYALTPKKSKLLTWPMKISIPLLQRDLACCLSRHMEVELLEQHVLFCFLTIHWCRSCSTEHSLLF